MIEISLCLERGNREGFRYQFHEPNIAVSIRSLSIFFSRYSVVDLEQVYQMMYHWSG